VTESMRPVTSIRIALPSWLHSFWRQLPERLEGPEERMRVAIDLSRRNVQEETGGPFGALVVECDSGRIIAAGVNRVEPSHCSSAHAEIVALTLAQQSLARWNLAEGDVGALELVSSCEPCAMCLGAIPWSGVRSLVCGAGKADAEAAGFDEGDRPDAWADKLVARGISVRTELLRREAAGVLRDYARSGQTIYNP